MKLFNDKIKLVEDNDKIWGWLVAILVLAIFGLGSIVYFIVRLLV